jgi:L-threonylcarbamoyladenylate synthase
LRTLVYKLKGDRTDKARIEKCAAIIRSGGLVAFPTETVYGLGANALDDAACAKIFAAKNRPAEKPLLCHLYSVEQAEEIAYLTDGMRKLIKAFTPGPLTVIAPKREVIGKTVCAGGNTVGLRFPSNKEALDLLRACGVPVAATSANISSFPAPTSAEDVKNYLRGRIDAILDCGVTGSGVASTIVSLEGGLKILREGVITEKQIREVLL